MGTTRQSDKQAIQVLNTANAKGEWDEIGYVLMNFNVCCIVGPWTGFEAYDSIEEIFFNTLFGFYSMLMNWWMIEKESGTDGGGVKKHGMPTVTLQNMSTTASGMVSRCLHHPAGLPFDPSSQTEIACETHFSRAKANNRGTTKVKDMIAGRAFHDAQDIWL